MMRKILYRRRPRMEPGFNLTPMLDMVFYLLFFFIMSTKMRDDAEERMDVRLPSAKSAQTVPTTPAPALTLTVEGGLYYQNRPVLRPQLDDALKALVRQGRLEIAIRGDKRVDYGRVIEVMDWCKLAGMKSVLLELGQPEGDAAKK